MSDQFRGSSYWSKRRKIKARVAQHMAEIEHVRRNVHLEAVPDIPTLMLRNSESSRKKVSVQKLTKPVNSIPTRLTSSHSVASLSVSSPVASTSRTASAHMEDIDDCDEEPVQSPIHDICTPVRISCCPATFPVSHPTSVTSRTTVFERKVLSGIEKLLTGLEELKTIVENSSRILVHLLEIQNEGVVAEEPLPDEIQLPCRSMAELTFLNETIESDAAIKKRLFSKLVAIGGSDSKATVSKAMGAVLGKAVAVQLNWFGRGKKTAFGRTPTCELLYKVVRKNPLCKCMTEQEFREKAGNWLRFAKDREGGRKERERSCC